MVIVAASMPLKNGLQQGCIRLGAFVDCFERVIDFVFGQFDDLRKETNGSMMRNFSQTTVSLTEFFVLFENAVDLRHERPIGCVNSACTPVESGLDWMRQRFVAIDGDDEQDGTLRLTGHRARQGRELQRGQTPDTEVQLAVRNELLSEAVVELFRAFAGANAVVNN